MEEKVLKKSKNGLAMVTLFILLYAAAIAAIIVGSIMVEQAETKAGWIVLIVAGGVYAAIGWIFFIGLKVLKPQEALVLTLFGKYVGTIKEAGFYFVNPFCVAVNPAASTKLNQSGDVTGDGKKLDLASMAGVAGMAIAAGNNSQSANKKISLKIMTLSNSRQKINDCLGNPVEIGIAVMWKVTDTAKAVFNVDNYKEYLLKKYQEIEETEQRWESFCTEDAEIVLVAYGISSRVSKEAVKIARAKGLKLGLIRPRTLWPYPRKAFDALRDSVVGFLSVEMSILGQMVDDIKLATDGKYPVHCYNEFANVPEPDIAIQMAEDMLKQYKK